MVVVVRRPHARRAAGMPVGNNAMPGASETLGLIPFPGSLVSPSASARLNRVARRLPAGSEAYCIECRLSDEPRVDLGAGYPYPACGRFLRGIKAAGQVPFVIMELDRASHRRGSPPALLLCVDRRMGMGAGRRAVPELGEPSLLALAGQASRLWLKTPLSTAMRETLRNCFRSLPEGGRVLHLSVMPARMPPVLKLNLSLPRPALPPYLRSIGWPGDFASLDRLWEAIGPFVRDAKIDLIVAEGLHPKLGIELFPSNATVKGRRSALRWLEARTDVSARKCAEMSAWRGSLWRIAGEGRRLIRIDLDFGLKIVLHPQGGLEAKGYLEFFPRGASIG